MRYHQIYCRISLSQPNLTPLLRSPPQAAHQSLRAIKGRAPRFASLAAGAAGAARGRGPAQTRKSPVADRTCAACREARRFPPAGRPALDTAAARGTRPPPGALGAPAKWAATEDGSEATESVSAHSAYLEQAEVSPRQPIGGAVALPPKAEATLGASWPRLTAVRPPGTARRPREKA